MSRTWCSALPATGQGKGGASGSGVRIAVQAMPGAKKSEVVGVLDDAIKIRLQAPALEGRANDALIRFLADRLDVPRSSITLTHGHTNKRKLLEVCHAGVTVEAVARRLLGES